MQWLRPVILLSQKGRIRRTAIQDQPMQKVGETPILTNKKLVTVEYTYHLSYTRSVNRRL
jgi:hypothetical protein